MSSSCIYLRARNQRELQRVNFAGATIPVERLRKIVGGLKHTDPGEIELSRQNDGGILVDTSPPVTNQSILVVRKRPQSQQPHRCVPRPALLSALPCIAVPLSQQEHRQFGLGTTKPDESGCAYPSAPPRPAPPGLPRPSSQFVGPVPVVPPTEFMCPLCNDYMRDAVIINCCYQSFCQACIEDALGPERRCSCPACHTPTPEGSPKLVIANRNLRAAITRLLNAISKSTQDPDASSPPFSPSPSPPSKDKRPLPSGTVEPTDKSLYQTLGVGPHVTVKEVTKAFHRQSLRLHPDKNPAASATAQFQALSHAHSVLSDVHKRRAYDREQNKVKRPRYQM